MFSDELEMLIDAAIADGEISEKERTILHKRAQAEGVDVDELDMIIDSRIKKNRQNQSTIDIKTVIADTESPLKILHKKIDEIKERYEARKNDLVKMKLEQGKSKEFDEDEYDSQLNDLEADLGDELKSAIKGFPTPTDKVHLIEFLSFAKQFTKVNRFNSDSWLAEDIAKGYKAKYKDCVEQVKRLYPNDIDFNTLLPEEKENKGGFFSKLFGKK